MTFTMPEKFADGDYPQNWASFIGQDKAKQQIKLAADSAKARRAPMDHTLIASGVPGIGKTSLALLAARQMGTNLTVVSGKIPLEQAMILMASMRTGDILFIDEAHKLVENGKKDAEWLLHYLQDGMLVGPYKYEQVPAVTIIAATTEAGRLPATIVGRFPIRPHLVPYTDDEAARIAGVLAKRVMDGHPQPSKANCADLAAAANNNPRAIRQLLVTLRDMAVTGMMKPSSRGYDIPTLLDWCGVSPDGLDMVAQEYLRVLTGDFQGKAGQRALEDRLQEPGGLADVERVLIEKQLIAKTASGRTITMAGARRARELAA